MLFCENICYLCRTISFDCKLIYFSYNFCCFFIDQQMVFIFWIMLIPIRNCTTASLARFHSGLKNSFDFLACVLCIPFIHDIQKWCKIIIRWCCTVNTIVDCNETDIFLWKQYFCIISDFQIISSQSAHILYTNGINQSCFHISNHFLKSRTVKGNSAESIICIVPDIRQSLCLCIFFQIILLIRDTV